MTQSENERVVMEAWESVSTSSIGVCIFTDRWNLFDDFAEARAFTAQRRKRIAEVEEEIEYMHKLVPMEHIEASHPLQRILAREQTILADLKRGMREKSKEEK